jgi:fibro-slime domain-containing protein
MSVAVLDHRIQESGMRSGLWLSLALSLCACGEDNSGTLDDGGASSGGSNGNSNAGTAGSNGSMDGGGTGSSSGGTSAGTTGSGTNAGSTGDAGEECGSLLRAIVRDMKDDHPDFETFSGQNAFLGIVQNQLGTDNKPVYAHAGATSQTTSPQNFAQWYNDAAGVNMPITVDLEFETASNGNFVFDDQEFFPIDNMGFGNDGRDHNFHFTTEIHTKFSYRGGEEFTFTGDDDLWLFINGKLAIDLGGLHQPRSATIDLNARAGDLGITVGQTYRMDIFHAERHTTQSTFRIETSIECFEAPEVD